jgi:hypothetical protein
MNKDTYESQQQLKLPYLSRSVDCTWSHGPQPRCEAARLSLGQVGERRCAPLNQAELVRGPELALLGCYCIALLVVGLVLPNPTQAESKPFPQPSKSMAIEAPEGGCLLGVYPGWGAHEDEVRAEKLQEFEKLSGKEVAFSPFSSFWGRRNVASQPLKEIARCGAIPILRLMPWGEPYWGSGYQPAFSLQSIVDGAHDGFLTQWTEVIRRHGGPIMVVFGPEMNGDWFSWSGVFQGGADTAAFGDSRQADGPERYIAAYRHIVDLFRRKEVKNVSWLFQANYKSHPDEPWNGIEAYYPGDAYVDWVGISLYGVQFQDEPWHGFGVLMDPAYKALLRLFPHKPLMLAEWGVGEWPRKGDKAAWYREVLEKLETTYPRISAAVVWHHCWKNTDGTYSNLRIDSSPEALEAYRAGVGRGHYLAPGRPPSPGR